MREFMVVISYLLAVTSARPEAGYSYSPPSGYYRPSSTNIGGYYYSGNSGFNNGYVYNRPSPIYGVQDIRDNFLPFGIRDKIPPPRDGVIIPPPRDGLSNDVGFSDTVGDTDNLDIDDLEMKAKADLNRMSKGVSGGVTPPPMGAVSNFGQASPSGLSPIKTNVYFFTAPKTLETFTPSTKIGPIPQPKINYKIIFIKTPATPTPKAPVIPALSQDKEKTLIYVLVKRPEDAPQITIPTVPPTAPSKPEVYFIRYKAQKETKAVDGVRPPTPKYGPPGYNGSY